MECAGELVEFSVSVIKLLNSGASSVESVQSDFRAIFSRLRVSRPATEGGRMAFKPGRLPSKPGGEALASSGSRSHARHLAAPSFRCDPQNPRRNPHPQQQHQYRCHHQHPRRGVQNKRRTASIRTRRRNSPTNNQLSATFGARATDPCLKLFPHEHLCHSSR